MSNDPVMPVQIDDSSVIPDVIMAIEESVNLLPIIPYNGHVLRPRAVGAVAKAIRKKFVRVAYLLGGDGILGASHDSKDMGPIILLPFDYKPGNTYSRSIAVHEAIHRAVDGAGFNTGFQISRFENEFIAHLGQACYAIRKNDDITRAPYTKTCVPAALPAATTLLKSGTMDSKHADDLRAAVAATYKSNYTIQCNGWWKD